MQNKCRQSNFLENMVALCHLVPNACKNLDEIGYKKWSYAYFPTILYNVMTFNDIESIITLTKHA